MGMEESGSVGVWAGGGVHLRPNGLGVESEESREDAGDGVGNYQDGVMVEGSGTGEAAEVVLAHLHHRYR